MPSLIALPPKLVPLVTYLESLTGRASIERLQHLLEESDATLDDVAPFVRFEPDSYQRNLICQSEWYELMVICWRSGQRSPIHNHAESTCGLKVLSGVCSETVFEHSPCGQVMAVSSRHLTAGQVCASQDSDTHQVSNLQDADEDLVTMHIYSPPLRSMEKFSITGGTVQTWRPAIMEFAQGAGI
jgi:cysteine dioxygenase